MSRAKIAGSGWQGASLVAITYVYFLIFAQFAFLKRLSSLGIADAHLKAVMAAMAAGGILLSLLAPRLNLWPSPNLRLRLGLSVSAVAAFFALLPLSFAAAAALAFLIGTGLGQRRRNGIRLSCLQLPAAFYCDTGYAGVVSGHFVPRRHWHLSRTLLRADRNN
jgi:hypothetical protein